MRRGIADLDGEGEVVGAVVVMRWGENASTTIDAVKSQLRRAKIAFRDAFLARAQLEMSDVQIR